MADILLIGGTGYLGRCLVRSLQSCGLRVCLSARDAGNAGMARVDLADTPALEALINQYRPKQILHLACGLIPSSTRDEYLEERVRVVEPTLRLARIAAQQGVGLTFVSSGGAVYGQTDSNIREDQECRPISFYGRSKLEIEQGLQRVASEEGLNLLVARPSNVFGRRERLSGPQGLIAAMLGSLREGRPLEVWGDGSSVRDYIYIDDFCSSLTTLIQDGASGTFNIGSGIGHSILEVADVVGQVLGRSLDIVFRPTRGMDVSRVVLDVAKLVEQKAFFTRPLAEGIRLYAREIGGFD